MKKYLFGGIGLLLLIGILSPNPSSSSSVAQKRVVAATPVVTKSEFKSVAIPTVNSVTIAPTPTSAPITPTSTQGLSNDNTYTNTAGNTVHSPAYSNSVPAGATAQCRDGTYSFS